MVTVPSTSLSSAPSTAEPSADLEPEQVPVLFKALADPVRLAVVQALAGGRALCL